MTDRSWPANILIKRWHSISMQVVWTGSSVRISIQQIIIAPNKVQITTEWIRYYRRTTNEFVNIFINIIVYCRSDPSRSTLPPGHYQISARAMVFHVQNPIRFVNIFEAVLQLLPRTNESSHVVAKARALRHSHPAGAGTYQGLHQQQFAGDVDNAPQPIAHTTSEQQ